MKIAAVLQRVLPPVWLGMVLAMAMEAQLKFSAPGVTREVGLGIGKLVFSALNRAECAIAVILAIAFFAFKAEQTARIIFGFLLTVLAAQTIWLMPRLIERIDQIISGQIVAESSIHFAYIALEIGKIILLLILSFLANRRDEQ